MSFKPDYALCNTCNNRLGEIIKEYTQEYDKLQADNEKMIEALRTIIVSPDHHVEIAEDALGDGE